MEIGSLARLDALDPASRPGRGRGAGTGLLHPADSAHRQGDDSPSSAALGGGDRPGDPRFRDLFQSPRRPRSGRRQGAGAGRRRQPLRDPRTTGVSIRPAGPWSRKWCERGSLHRLVRERGVMQIDAQLALPVPEIAEGELPLPLPFPVIDDESGVLESDLAPGLDGKPEVFRHPRPSRSRRPASQLFTPSEMIVAPWEYTYVYYAAEHPGILSKRWAWGRSGSTGPKGRGKKRDRNDGYNRQRETMPTRQFARQPQSPGVGCPRLSTPA